MKPGPVPSEITIGRKCGYREFHASYWRMRARKGKSFVVTCTHPLCGISWRTYAEYAEFLEPL